VNLKKELNSFLKACIIFLKRSLKVEGDPMSYQRYFIRMSLCIALIAGAGAILYPFLAKAFLANPALNGVILLTFLFGVVYTFHQVFNLKQEAKILDDYHTDRFPLTHNQKFKILSPLSSLLSSQQNQMSLNLMGRKILCDQIAGRLDEKREIARYTARLLIFLGLLGTFWGLLQTIQAVGGVISNLSVGEASGALAFTELKSHLAAPLAGMGIGFSSSLFGLAGSLVLSFLDLQMNQAQHGFYTHFEEWLNQKSTNDSKSTIDQDTLTPSAYIHALWEKTLETLERLESTLHQGEESRYQVDQSLNALTDRLSLLADHIRDGQESITQITGLQRDIGKTLEQFNDHVQQKRLGIDDATRHHIRNMDLQLGRLNEEMDSSRSQVVQEMRNEIRLLAKTISVSQEKKQEFRLKAAK
jgi:biopolymer transport protein ExbB/TolQ